MTSTEAGQFSILTPDAVNSMNNLQVKYATFSTYGNTTSSGSGNITITNTTGSTDWFGLGTLFDSIYNFFVTIYNFFVFIYNGLVTLYVLFTFNSAIGWITTLIFAPFIVTLVYVIIKSLPTMGGGA
jgi:ABC-type multidrug transport system permease subunit